jgi:phytoene/squalene synthetase
MTLGTELGNIAELLREAAKTIDEGVWGSFADEEKQHPQAKDWRATQRRCNRLAETLEKMAAAAKS